MKLYFSKGACSLTVRIIVNELNLPCEYESVDLKSKKTESDQDFYKINPKGVVPTLQLDNGEILTENAVILQYLADSNKAFQLLPPTSEFKRYRILEWINFVSTEMHKGVSPLFNQKYPQEVKDDIVIPALKNKLTHLNNHLHHNQFLLGNDFTLPDAYLFVVLRWLLFFKFLLAEWPHVERYWEELKKRPSIAKSIEQESLKFAPA